MQCIQQFRHLIGVLLNFRFLFLKVASLYLFWGHFAFVSEKKSFYLSRKIFSVSKKAENRDIFARYRNDDHNSLICNRLCLREFSELAKQGRPFFCLDSKAKKHEAVRLRFMHRRCASYILMLDEQSSQAQNVLHTAKPCFIKA